MFLFTLFFLALGGAGLHVRLSALPRSPQQKAELLLLWLLVVGVGLNGLVGFFGHVFAARWNAAYLGWPAGTPFQGEVGFAHLATGVLGLLCLRRGGQFRLAAGIAASIYYFGAAIVQVKTAVAARTITPGNAGALLPQLLIPVLLLALLAVLARFERGEADPWGPRAGRT